MIDTSAVTDLDERLLQAGLGVLRPAAGCLAHPYLAPGGTYSEQLWDWDSFWIVTALLEMTREAEGAVRRSVLEHARGSWLNFMEHQQADGRIAILLTPEEGNVFDGLADGVERNQAKPVLGQMAQIIAEALGDYEWLRPWFAGLIQFQDLWFEAYRASCGLLVWGSDVAIGVDNDPTVYGRPEFSSAHLLLNCLYYEDLLASAQIARQLSFTSEAVSLERRAEVLAGNIRDECWDSIDSFYYTVDVACADHRDKYIPPNIARGMDMAWRTMPLKVKMFTGFLPMWCGIATKEQACLLVERHFCNADEFDAACGLPTLAMNERMYLPDVDTANPSNWNGPVWLVASYMVYHGLQRYGYSDLAAGLARKTRALLADDLMKTGCLHECYHPQTGKPNFNGGFASWNLLAALM